MSFRFTPVIPNESLADRLIPDSSIDFFSLQSPPSGGGAAIVSG
jgi:hypothetical protein